MKIDVYTKVILTGIFLCLCLLLLRDVRFVDKAHAELSGGIPATITLLIGEYRDGFDIDD